MNLELQVQFYIDIYFGVLCSFNVMQQIEPHVFITRIIYLLCNKPGFHNIHSVHMECKLPDRHTDPQNVAKWL